MPWTFFDKYGQLRVNSGMAMAVQELAYQEFSTADAGVNVTVTTEAGASTIVSAPALVFDGLTPVIVTAFCPYWLSPAVNGAYLMGEIFDSVTGALGYGGLIATPSASTTGLTFRTIRRITPAAGSHIFSLRAWVSSGTGVYASGPGGAGHYVPGFIRVSRADWAVYNPGAVPKITTGLLSAGPPANPQDGDIWIATNIDANGARWQFQYDIAEIGSYKWKFIGGPSLQAEVIANELKSLGGYAALATPGPSIAIPRAGDYDVMIGAWIYANAATTSYMSYDIGATGAVDADYVRLDSAAANNSAGVSRIRRKAGLAAVTLTAKYAAAGGTSNFINRWMQVTPVRIS